MLAVLGVLVFTSSLFTLHRLRPDIDWTRHYVSDWSNEPLGWIFVSAALVHGLGNIFLTLGLRGALGPGSLRTWGVILLGLSAIGILLAALFPVDPSGALPTLVGRLHRTAAGGSFLFELLAVFVFSAAFSRDPYWQPRRSASLGLSSGAALALLLFVISIPIDLAPGLTERVVLTFFLAWEFWASVQLFTPRGIPGRAAFSTRIATLLGWNAPHDL